MLLSASCVVEAGTISSYPRNTAANPPDLLLLDVWNGTGYTTMTIDVTNLSRSPAVYQFITNLVAGIRATNGNGYNTTISNMTVNGSFLYTNTSTTSNSLRIIVTGTNNPATQMPLLAQVIYGGNTNFLDTLNIACANDLPNNYADITWGNFNSAHIGTAFPDYNQEFEMGISSLNGNWNTPFPGQSNYGVFAGAWQTPAGNCLVLECNGTNPYIIAGHVISGEISPTWFISGGHSNVFVTDRFSGRTNYFDMDRSTASFNVPYGNIFGGSGFASTASMAQGLVVATGTTNNLGVLAKLFLTAATPATFTNFNSAGTPTLTNTFIGTNVLVDILQQGGYCRSSAAALGASKLDPL